MDPLALSISTVEDTSYLNEVLSEDLAHLKQRPCYQRRSPQQDPVSHRTTRRPGNGQEMQTEVVRPSGLAKNILRGTMTGGRKRGTQKKSEEVGRQRQRMDRARVRQHPGSCGEQEKMKRARCKVVSGAPTIRMGYGKVK